MELISCPLSVKPTDLQQMGRRRVGTAMKMIAAVNRRITAMCGPPRCVLGFQGHKQKNLHPKLVRWMLKIGKRKENQREMLCVVPQWGLFAPYGLCCPQTETQS